MNTTRMGAVVSAQISKMGEVTNLGTANFSVAGTPFNIKNDGETAVVLEVNLWDMEEGTFIATRFETGWNPEIVREIKQNGVLTNPSLKWGC